MNDSPASWTDCRVLITGVCGTVGREALRQVLSQEPREVIGLDSNESELFFLKQEFAEQRNVYLYVGDIRDLSSLAVRMAGIDIVVHTAAYKHVSLCEASPRETVANNVLGIQNLIEAATSANVARVLFTSSDKAVNPTSVMGTSKLMGERLMAAADDSRRGERPLFICTRFGNVLGSRGSVIPLFKRQILAGGPVTLTHPETTRFIMSLDEAVRLVMGSLFIAQGGEVFVTKMRSVRIKDLAEVMIAELAPIIGRDPEQILLDVIGTRPGEKLHEELLNDEEARRTVELEDFFVVSPALRPAAEVSVASYGGLVRAQVDAPYNSGTQPHMDRDELREFLNRHALLETRREPGQTTSD